MRHQLPGYLSKSVPPHRLGVMFGVAGPWRRHLVRQPGARHHGAVGTDEHALGFEGADIDAEEQIC